MDQEWCTIESDPDVFSELIEKMGVKDVGVSEIYSLEDRDLVEALEPIYGLVFLFKYTGKELPRNLQEQSHPNDLFYAEQVITNACATQAILSILLNLNHKVDIGQTLKDFKAFSQDMDSQMKGLAISNSDQIRNVHNSFQRPSPFQVQKESRMAKEGDDVYHFISYVPFGKRLYELDGLQKRPILLGEFDGDDWMSLAKTHIQQRITNYSANEVHFNLLAIIQDKSTQWNNQLQNNLNQITQLISQQKDSSLIDKLKMENQQLQHNIQNHQFKAKKQQADNARRRHNYVPLIIKLLEMSAKKGILQDQMDKLEKK